MKKLRSLICAAVVTALAATTIITTSAVTLPEGSSMGLDLLPESTDELIAGTDCDGGFIPTLDENGLSLEYTEEGEAHSFTQAIFMVGEEINVNEMPNIRIKTHFTRTTDEVNLPRVNLRINYTNSLGESNYLMMSYLDDVFEISDAGAINVDTEATINFFELLNEQNMLTVDGLVMIDEVSYWMGGDAGLVLTYDYLYFEEGTPTLNGEETTTSELLGSSESSAAATSSAADDESSAAASSTGSSAATSSRASTSSRAGTSSSNDEDMTMWIVIGAVAAVVVIAVIVLIVVKTKKSSGEKTDGASDGEADEKKDDEKKDDEEK